MKMHGSRFLGFIYWATYCIAALACWLTTYQVFVKSDTPLVAGLAAASIDGVLALTLYMMGRTRHQDQKTTALIGTIIFGVFSGFAQVVHRFDGLGIAMPQWMQVVSLFLLPASTTGGLVLLGVIKYFSSQGGDQGGGGGNKQQNQGGGNQSQYNQRPYQDVTAPSQHAPEPRLAQPQRPSQVQAPNVKTGGSDVLDLMQARRNGNGHVFATETDMQARLVDDRNPTSPA